jgi:UDP-N-acetylglucosamine acyltransferase
VGKPKIHKSSIVAPGAKLSEGVEVGPYCIIGKGVKIGKNSRLSSHVVVEETLMGSNNVVYPFTSIGLPPQDIEYNGEKTKVLIGDRNIIREYITIHRASVRGDGKTEIGDDNFLMAYVHLAHDCKIGSSVTMANAANLAGHVMVQDYAVIGGLVAIHQFTRIGEYAMVGGFSGVGQDVPPYMTASGSRARLYGLNTVGLKRRGFDEATIKDLKRAYKILFRSKLTLKEAINKTKLDIKHSREIDNLIQFLTQNRRGICR